MYMYHTVKGQCAREFLWCWLHKLVGIRGHKLSQVQNALIEGRGPLVYSCECSTSKAGILLTSVTATFMFVARERERKREREREPESETETDRKTDRHRE